MNCYYFYCGEKAAETEKILPGEIAEWLRSPELKKIVEVFGGKYSQNMSIDQIAGWLLEFSDHWDYRGKQRTAREAGTGEAARWMINNDSITDVQRETVLANIEKLGLRGISKPRYEQYDYVVALGGARMSCLLRPRYIKELLDKNIISAGAVVLLSGMRPVGDSERDATDSYAPGAQTEYDLINTGAENVFGLRKEYVEERYCCPEPNRSWAIRTYTSSGFSFPILSVSGPSSQPEIRRANSADTFRFLAKRRQIQPGSKILLITSQIYVPYQQMEAIRTWALPNNVYVETVGFPVEWNEGRQQGMMTAANYLQEIRSAIQAINRYLRER